MKKTMRQIVKTSYGLGLLGFRRAKKTVGQIKKDLNLSEDESLRLARDMLASSEKISKEVLSALDKNLSRSLTQTGLVSNKDIAKVKKAVKKKVVKMKAKKTLRKVKNKVKGKLKRKK